MSSKKVFNKSLLNSFQFLKLVDLDNLSMVASSRVIISQSLKEESKGNETSPINCQHNFKFSKVDKVYFLRKINFHHFQKLTNKNDPKACFIKKCENHHFQKFGPEKI